MKILFSQLYSEVNTNYNITNTVLDALTNELNKLNKTLSHYEKLFKQDEYSVIFVISATRNKKELVKGPQTISKKRKIYFSLFIPYKTFDSFLQQINYIIDHITEGIIIVFNKYKSPTHGVKEAIEEAKQLILKNPEKYQIWTERTASDC